MGLLIDSYRGDPKSLLTLRLGRLLEIDSEVNTAFGLGMGNGKWEMALIRLAGLISIID